jgi:hypothetical protein
MGLPNRIRSFMSPVSALTILVASLASGVARADFDTGPAPLIQLEVNTTSADTYLQYHGRAFTRVGDGAYEEYRWGGTSCGSRTLSEEQVAVLQRALDNTNVKVAFRYQDGQGASQCVVGFWVVRKSYAALVP